MKKKWYHVAILHWQIVEKLVRGSGTTNHCTITTLHVCNTWGSVAAFHPDIITITLNPIYYGTPCGNSWLHHTNHFPFSGRFTIPILPYCDNKKRDNEEKDDGEL